MKSQSLNYKRIVIKAGTAVLTQGEEHSQLNEQNIKNLPSTYTNSTGSYKLFKKCPANKSKSLSEHFNIN